MRNIFFLALFFTGLISSSGQDSIRAVNIFQHQIIDGKKMSGKSVTEQKTYDLKDRLVLQIYYFDSVPNIESFIRLYYTEDNLISKETFSIENEVLRITRYSYNEEGLLSEKNIFEPVKNKIRNSKTVKFSYSSDKLSSKIVLNDKGKWQKKYKYVNDDNREMISIKYNKKSKSPLSSEEIIKYFEGPVLSKKVTIRTFTDKHQTTEQIDYSYNEKKGNIIEETWYMDGEISKQIIYSWFVNGTLNRKSIYDSENTLIEHLSHKYLQRIVVLGDTPMYEL